jgi:hypothetical protein
MRINTKEVEENVSKLATQSELGLNFVYDLLLAYGKSKTAITRLKKGDYNLATDKSTEIYWKSNLLFKYVEHADLHATIDDLKGTSYATRHSPRFIIVTDYSQLLAIDTKTQETLDIPIREINRHYVFFLPWAGMEKSSAKTENIADVKAAERMAKLYDEIIKHNVADDPAFYHALNVFFSRLLFCFFAEDTEVFSKGQFTNSIASYTQADGSDLHEYLDELFRALDVENKGSDYPEHIAAFPYVNGGLFGKYYASPKFNAQAKRLIIECGELNWSEINPDIFGSMIQAVVHPGQRAGLGMHYTSVVNIMKVIEPLFLEELLEEFDKSYDDKKKLQKLLSRIYGIKVFDPACGSGNFLIIAYKEMRRLEHKTIERINELSGGAITLFQMSGIQLESFYGIEIDDFAHEIAILSLWLAKHQMNIEFKAMFNIEIPLIPLKDAGNIVCENAATADWNTVCPNNDTDEIYIIGNPPYLGSRNQESTHKKDLQGITSNYKSMDYIAIWFIKGARYIENTNSRLAFVSTNSVSQGEQVGILWPGLLNNLEIGFAHTSFKWANNARASAGVTCVIISLQNKNSQKKRIYTGGAYLIADHINAYLTPGRDAYIQRRSKPLSALPTITFGSMTNDKGNLILSTSEKDKLIEDYPFSRRFIKRFIGSAELLRGQERWCLWIQDEDLEQALAIPEIKRRLENVTVHRNGSSEKSTQQLAATPHRFYFFAHKETDSIIIPRVSSERRDYIPIGYLTNDTIISDSANAIYDAEPFVFGLLSSRMHMTWVRAVAGRLKTDFRYSSAIVYNNFPVPPLSEKQKAMITNHVFEVLDARETHSEKTLSELYDPDKMPDDLRNAHEGLNEIIELCYRSKPFENDEERLAYLFKLYEIMTATQKELINA